MKGRSSRLRVAMGKPLDRFLTPYALRVYSSP